MKDQSANISANAEELRDEAILDELAYPLDLSVDIHRQ